MRLGATSAASQQLHSAKTSMHCMQVTIVIPSVVTMSDITLGRPMACVAFACGVRRRVSLSTMEHWTFWHAEGGIQSAEETKRLLLQCMPPAHTLLRVAADHLRTQGGHSTASPSHLLRIVQKSNKFWALKLLAGNKMATHPALP